MNLFKNELRPLRPFMSVCVCWGGGGGRGGRDGDKVVNFFIFLFISSRIFENVIVKWTCRVQQFFFSAEISKVAIIKTKSATIAFFSSPPFLLLPLSFSPFLFLC